MSTSPDFVRILKAARDRQMLAPLVRALGFEPCCEPVPRSAWAAYGLGAAADVHDIVQVGLAGSLHALLLETEPGTGPDRVRWLATRVKRRNIARTYLFLFAAPGYRRLTIGTFGVEDDFRHLTLERDRLRASDTAALEEMVPDTDETGLALALRHAAALGRSRVTRRFFRDFRERRDALADAWLGIPVEAEKERSQLALLVLSRLTFLYFLQRRGALLEDERFLPKLFGAWAGSGDAGDDASTGETFFRSRLRPLFFGALNRRPADRDATARALGPLPYLNGGLFEPHTLERRFPRLDLPDHEVRLCFDALLERYRFTAREAGDGAGHGIDPEILGRVFEELMAPEDRGASGSFYTPANAVNRVVREGLATYMTGVCSRDQASSILDGDARELTAETRHRVRGRLERIRILDPACGSGAFLVGALHRLALGLGAVSDDAPGTIRRRIVADSLHGVDLLDNAALLCSLRLWLALSIAEDELRPLPNLDRRIRQGDALVDPLDLGTPDAGHGGWNPTLDRDIRTTLRELEPTARAYLESGPDRRADLRARITRLEQRLARHWLDGTQRARQERLRRLRALAADRDLFGAVPEYAERALRERDRVERRLAELDGLTQALDEEDALPFFSFGVHFAHTDGFDLVLSNPPWVRAHRWPERLRRMGERFEVCRDPAWARASALTGAPAGAGAQVDLSLLFMERSIRLLAPGGVLAVLVPAKSLRAIYGGAARRILLRDLEFALIEDHALDQRSIFRADSYVAVLIGKKRGRPTTRASGSPVTEEGGVAGAGREAARVPRVSRQVSGTHADGRLRVRMVRRGVPPLEFSLAQRELPLFADDPAAPWLIVPPEVGAVFRRMQRAGPPLGDHPGLRVRRGVMTGANDVLVFDAVAPKLGGLAVVEAAGYDRCRRQGRSRAVTGRYRGVLELSGLRPLVRGAGVDAFRYRTESYVAWCHDPSTRPKAAPPRLGRYLERHAGRLRRRSGWRSDLPLGCLFRLSEATLRPKVAWHDLSDTLRAVALPATIPVAGVERELIPLNTVYFLPTDSDAEAVALAGLFNALPVTAMARSLAERAKDARFRFFAWTVSCLPLPKDWSNRPGAAEIRRISEHAHRAGGIDPGERDRLDRAAARLYGLTAADLEVLARFDAWLRGEP